MVMVSGSVQRWNIVWVSFGSGVRVSIRIRL